MSFTLHRLRKRIAAFIGQTADLALFIGIVLIGGLGSSWYMVEAGSRLTTVTVGPWTTWTAAARSDADPYTRAHYSRLGVLPLSAEFAQTWVARNDSDGRALHSSCSYELDGRNMPNYWWSVALFDADGHLIQNIAERYAFTSDTIALRPDGTYIAGLARDARPGNWLPTGGAGRLALVFTIVDLGVQAVANQDDLHTRLPVIKRVAC